MLQKQPLSGNQRPDLLTYLIHVSLVLRLPCKTHLSRSSSNIPRLPTLLKLPQNHHIFLTFDKVHNPLRLPRENDIWTSKSCPSVVFCTFWLWHVLRHNGVHFFDSLTSKSASTLKCFVHFDLGMRFAPQRRALFRELNFQKCSGVGVFCTFWLPNVFRATAARTFSRAQLPKVLRRWCVLHILTSKCVSRHYGAHFFEISTSKSAATLRCFVHFDFEICFAPQRRAIFHLSFAQFSKPTFRPSGAKCCATFLRFRALASSFFWLFLLSDLPSSSLLFSSLTLSTSAFSSVQVVGSLTSKIPSVIPIFF